MIEDEFLKYGTSLTRLRKEYKKHGSLVIGFDFDGTVHDFHNKGVIYPKMIQLLRDLKLIGCKLICWTCYKDHTYVADYLKSRDIPFDEINTNGINLPWETRKPYFSALLDDRAGLIQMYHELNTLVNSIKAENGNNARNEA
jgi:hypothetical protein